MREDVAPDVPFRDERCRQLGQHEVVYDGTCVHCGDSRRHEGESAFAYPMRHELPHGWPDDDVRTVPAVLLVGLAQAVHHAENVLRRPNERCTGCRLIAGLPDDLREYLATDRLRST